MKLGLLFIMAFCVIGLCVIVVDIETLRKKINKVDDGDHKLSIYKKQRKSLYWIGAIFCFVALGAMLWFVSMNVV